MVQGGGEFLLFEVLHLQDVLKVVQALLGVLLVGWQVAVQEADRVAVERQTDGDPSLVALRDKRLRLPPHSQAPWGTFFDTLPG